MKFRKDFVTNSSSSSYICEICGEEYSGYDAGLSDAKMVECVNGHTFCEIHIKLDANKREILLAEFGENYDESDVESIKNMDDGEFLSEYLDEYDARYEVHPCLCPICSFECGRDSDVASYLRLKYHITDEEILNELKSKFKDYASFKKFMKDSGEELD